MGLVVIKTGSGILSVERGLLRNVWGADGRREQDTTPHCMEAAATAGHIADCSQCGG